MPDLNQYCDEIIRPEGKNARNVKCKHCGSIILTPCTATFTSFEYELPLMQQRKTNFINPETETVASFWVVTEMYSFHNVGFSNTVGDTKYLTCADCEAGPVGYHNLSTKISYVALSRVEHG